MMKFTFVASKLFIRKIQYLLIILFLSGMSSFGQDYYTIISNSYVITNNNKETKVNGIISLTYSKEFSFLYIEGKGTLTFQNEQYTREMYNSGFKESFLSGETSTTLAGHYLVRIFQLENNNILSLGSFTTGSSYYAEHAKLYSENGKVAQNANLKNWKELIEKEEQRKNIIKNKIKLEKDSIRKSELKDSLNIVRRDSLKVVKEENSLLSGETEIFLDRDTEFKLNDMIEKKVKLKKGEFIFCNWNLNVDKEGRIINARPAAKGEPNFRNGSSIINSYVESINNLLINQKIKPFTRNGKTYPFHSIIYISVSSLVFK
jgi:hypothetical protein